MVVPTGARGQPCPDLIPLRAPWTLRDGWDQVPGRVIGHRCATGRAEAVQYCREIGDDGSNRPWHEPASRPRAPFAACQTRPYGAFQRPCVVYGDTCHVAEAWR